MNLINLNDKKNVIVHVKNKQRFQLEKDKDNLFLNTLQTDEYFRNFNPCELSKLEENLSFEQARSISCYLMTKYKNNILKYIEENKILTIIKPIALDPVFTIENELQDYIIIKITPWNLDHDDLPEKIPDEVVHEILIGVLGTNQLRSFIPNFAYVYGGFKIPICLTNNFPSEAYDNIKEGYDIKWWDVLNDNITCTMAFYEKIPGPTLDTFCTFCDFEGFLDVLIQIVLSLKMALRIVDFTHYDLHVDNIIIKPLSNFIDIKYDGYEITTNMIATFIDYGSSHIKVDGINYGRVKYETYGVLPDQSFWLMDIVKMLLFIYTNNNSTFIIHNAQLDLDSTKKSLKKKIKKLSIIKSSGGNSEFLEEKIAAYEKEIADYEKIISKAKVDMITRPDFHNGLVKILSFFTGDNIVDMVDWVTRYKRVNRYNQIYRTEYNKNANIDDFIEFLINDI